MTLRIIILIIKTFRNMTVSMIWLRTMILRIMTLSILHSV
jgi:hypothetical protein